MAKLNVESRVVSYLVGAMIAIVPTALLSILIGWWGLSIYFPSILLFGEWFYQRLLNKGK